MNNISCSIFGFTRDQTIFVYNDSGIIHYQKVINEKLPESLLILAKRFDVKNIELYGHLEYIEKFKQDFQTLELNKYGINCINIKCTSKGD